LTAPGASLLKLDTCLQPETANTSAAITNIFERISLS
jgi:hypothetical protein